MADNIIEISATPVAEHTVKLVGKTYKVKKIKSALGVMLAKKFSGKSDIKIDEMDKMINDLVVTVFGSEASKVRKRLEDPKDDLDFEHIIELIQKLSEAQTGNPTT